MSIPLGFRVREKRDSFWIGDSSVDQEAIQPARDYLSKERSRAIEEAEALANSVELGKSPLPEDKPPFYEEVKAYFSSGKTQGLPMKEGESVTSIVYRALTAEERSRVIAMGINPGDGKLNFLSVQVMCFAVGCDLPEIGDSVEFSSTGGKPKKIKKFYKCPESGLKRLHPDIVDWLASLPSFGMEAIYHFGGLVLAGSEASEGESKSGAGNV